MKRKLQEHICLCKDCGNLDYVKNVCKKCGSSNLEIADNQFDIGISNHMTWMKNIFEQQLYIEKDQKRNAL